MKHLKNFFDVGGDFQTSYPTNEKDLMKKLLDLEKKPSQHSLYQINLLRFAYNNDWGKNPELYQALIDQCDYSIKSMTNKLNVIEARKHKSSKSPLNLGKKFKNMIKKGSFGKKSNKKNKGPKVNL